MANSNHHQHEEVTVIPTATLRVGPPNNSRLALPGRPVSVSRSDMQTLANAKLIKPVDSTQIIVNPTIPQSASMHDAEIVDAIVDLIPDLDPEDFGKDKKPSVKAIESALEMNISAEQRDRAWSEYQKLEEG